LRVLKKGRQPGHARANGGKRPSEYLGGGLAEKGGRNKGKTSRSGKGKIRGKKQRVRGNQVKRLEGKKPEPR